MTVSVRLSDSVFIETHGLETAVDSEYERKRVHMSFRQMSCVSAGTRKRRSKRAMSAAASIAILTWHDLEANMQGDQFLVPMVNLILGFQLNFAIFCGHTWANIYICEIFKICSPERSDCTQ